MIEEREVERLRRHLRAIVLKCDDADSIARMTALQGEFEQIIAAQVRELKSQGFTWEEIGTPLGISRQAAFQRYSEAVITPIGYQGPARHSYTPGCDGFHESLTCPEPKPAPVVISLVREAYDAAVAEVGPPPPDLYQPGGFEVSPPWRSTAEGEWDSSR